MSHIIHLWKILIVPAQYMLNLRVCAVRTQTWRPSPPDNKLCSLAASNFAIYPQSPMQGMTNTGCYPLPRKPFKIVFRSMYASVSLTIFVLRVPEWPHLLRHPRLKKLSCQCWMAEGAQCSSERRQLLHPPSSSRRGRLFCQKSESEAKISIPDGNVKFSFVSLWTTLRGTIYCISKQDRYQASEQANKPLTARL